MENTNAHFASFTYDPETGQRQQPDGWTPVFMTDQAVDIIKQREQAADKPWMMVVVQMPTRPTRRSRRTSGPTTVEIPLRPNVRFSMSDLDNPVAALHDEARLRDVMLGYYGAITGIDEQFARLLKALDDTGQAYNTIVIFTSDHGEMLGSQGRMQKQCPFEELVRVPFIVLLSRRHQGEGTIGRVVRLHRHLSDAVRARGHSGSQPSCRP